MCIRFLMRVRQVAVTGCLLALCGLAGCGGRSDLGSVSGQVTLDGKPVPTAYIVFRPTGASGAPSFGKTDESGNYRMMFSDTQEGAAIGENAVTITTAGGGLAPGMGSAEMIPAVYNSKSTLLETVKSGQNQIDFKLESKAGKVLQPVDPDAPAARKK